jgi:hypothetical protein
VIGPAGEITGIVLGTFVIILGEEVASQPFASMVVTVTV